MSMARLVKQLVGTAFDVIDDLAPAGSISRDTGDVYDVSTGTVTNNAVAVPIKQIIPTRFKATELDDSVDVSTDAKFIVYAPDLPFTPENDDRITFNSNDWNIVKVMGVPGESIWVLHVRQK